MTNDVSSFGLRHSSLIRISGFVILILASLAGCAANEPTLTLHPANNGRPFTASFTRAFWLPDQAGEDQVVLLNDPIDVTSGASGDPLPPQTVPPIRQVLVIQMQWRSAISRADTPASSNAVLNWYVYGGGFASMIHYTGSAYVSISPTGADAMVEISHGSLKLADKTGPLQDPLGAFAVDGTVDAINSPAQLQQVMKDLTAAQAEAQQANQPPTTEPLRGDPN